jgi:hypothetical protein
MIMKKIFLLCIIVFNYFIVLSQNIGIGTLSPAGKLHIKGSADTSQLIVDANATQSSTHPLIRLRNSSGTDLLHIHSDDVSNAFIGLNAGKFNNAAGGGTFNTFIGSAAGNSNTTGSSNTANGSAALFFNTAGSSNTASGNTSLYFNITGNRNTAIGYEALYFNASGNDNTANGCQSLYSNTLGIENAASGAQALYLNTTGSYNTANGFLSLYSNTTGNENTANGVDALSANTLGTYNAASGAYALFQNTTGSFNTANGTLALLNTTASLYNTALGCNAGSTYDNGYNNVFLGANVDVNGAGYYNVIAIGQGTICTGSSQVTIGNGATGSYRAYANWSNISDGRFKRNIQENVPGLDFITQLRPVTYNLNATGLDEFLHSNNQGTVMSSNKIGKSHEKITSQPYSDAAQIVYNKALKEKETAVYTGFVAQEVEKTAKRLGFNFSGIDAPKNENDVYGLRYAEFVVPLVKAVQEQQQMIQSQNDKIALLEKQIEELKALIKK